ncbi:hypothetical protein WR25_24560 [Diploscapter pachys]|uniref:Uncharacterized protein n=1 Tax=Diploscapter pachys TaxID=2018661 RepID=A0A2A2KG78_9BILA|nr:hypothetical protein WR25_24560 [Diploscapter pachys]
MVVGEGIAFERAVAARGLVEHRDMRMDVALVDQPGQHLRRAVSGVGGQPLGPDAEAALHPRDHALARAYLGLAHRGARFHVHDDGVVEIDEVVGRVGVEGRPAMRAGPARCWIGRCQILGHYRCRGAERGIVENGEILAHRTAASVRCQALAARAAGLAVGIGADQAGVDREPFAAHQPLVHASRDRRLEQPAQQVAVAEAPVLVL